MNAHARPRPAVEVWVSEHAKTRARERFPGFKTARIIDEVREAMLAGRIGIHPDGGYLHAWNDLRSYPLKSFGGDVLVVATTVARWSSA